MDGRKKVLIVDDDEILCSLLCASLHLKGWNPEWVGNFGSAMVAVRGGFDVVLLDPGLPDSMPVQTIQNLGRLRDAGGRRVYIITGAPVDEKLRCICAEYGADGLISKHAPDFILGLAEVFGT